MPRAKTLGEFAVDAAAMANALPAAMAKATGTAALGVTNTARDAIRRDSGGDMILSGMGARVGARYDVKGTINPVALIRATGPMQIIENDTRAHHIAAGSRRTRRRKGARALLTPFGPKASVDHPGTRGKHTWARAIDKATPRVPKVYQEALSKHLRRFFG